MQLKREEAESEALTAKMIREVKEGNKKIRATEKKRKKDEMIAVAPAAKKTREPNKKKRKKSGNKKKKTKVRLYSTISCGECLYHIL